jgi:hypothetical protein
LAVALYKAYTDGFGNDLSNLSIHGIGEWM